MCKVNACLIDDDMVSVFLTKVLLMESQCVDRVEEYTSPVQAVEMLIEKFQRPTESLPELIFLDLNMPVLSGWDVLNKLRERKCDVERKTKLFVLTSSVAAEDKNKSNLFSEVKGFISKPLTRDKIKAICEEHFPAA